MNKIDFQLKVLLIDDEEQVLKFYSELLQGYFQVSTAANINRAVELLNIHYFDVIVCDHHLQGSENGIDFLISIHAAYPDITKIVLTGCLDQQVVLKSHNSRIIFKYLVKPCDNSELIENIKLAGVARQVLLIQQKIEDEHRVMKQVIGESEVNDYKIERQQQKFLNLMTQLTRSIVAFCIVIFLLGAAVLILLYCCKSLLGFDIFN